MYYILVNRDKIAKHKMPETVIEAYRRQYSILDYSFVFQCMEDFQLHDTTDFRIVLDETLPHVTKEQSLYAKHFRKVPRMISLLKKEQKKRSVGSKKVKVCLNPVLFYANLKRKESVKGKKVSFREHSKLFGKYCKEFQSLPHDEKGIYVDMWKEKKRQTNEFRSRRVALKAYNSTTNPLFRSQNNM